MVDNSPTEPSLGTFSIGYLVGLLGKIQNEAGRQSAAVESLDRKMDEQRDLAERRDDAAAQQRNATAQTLQHVVVRVALIEQQLKNIMPADKGLPPRLGGPDRAKFWSAVGMGGVTFLGAIGYAVSPFVPMLIQRILEMMNLR